MRGRETVADQIAAEASPEERARLLGVLADITRGLGVVIDQHATCQHVAYRLTCEQFDVVLERAAGACELCDRADLRLFIDHAHTTGLAYGPVRGLLCPKCNAHMRRIDSGERIPDERTRAYLNRATE